jgi:hypothetical protein
MYRGLLVASLVIGVAATSATFASSQNSGTEQRPLLADWRLDWLHGDLPQWRGFVRIDQANGQ